MAQVTLKALSPSPLDAPDRRAANVPSASDEDVSSFLTDPPLVPLSVYRHRTERVRAIAVQMHVEPIHLAEIPEAQPHADVFGYSGGPESVALPVTERPFHNAPPNTDSGTTGDIRQPSFGITVPTPPPKAAQTPAFGPGTMDIFRSPNIPKGPAPSATAAVQELPPAAVGPVLSTTRSRPVQVSQTATQQDNLLVLVGLGVVASMLVLLVMLFTGYGVT